jgi:hypothetical protein
MQNKKAEKKQAEYNEIYNKAYIDITRKNDSIANVNSKKELTTKQDTSKCLFFIIGDGKIHSK